MAHRVRNPLAIGYIILVVGVTVAFVFMAKINADLQQEVKFRQAGICKAYDQLEVILSDIVAETGSGNLNEDLAEQLQDDPELQAILRNSAQRSERFRQRVDELLEETECPVFPPPEDING